MARGRGRIFERADEHFNKAVSVLASDTAERGRYLKQLQTAAVWTVVRRAAASSCVPRWSVLVRAGPCCAAARVPSCPPEGHAARCVPRRDLMKVWGDGRVSPWCSTSCTTPRTTWGKSLCPTSLQAARA